jgi:hypothetical protein
MATALRCRWVRRRLALLAGDPEGRDVRWDDRRLVERHLIGCASCRAERDSLDSAMSALHGGSGDPAPSRRDAPSIWPALDRQIRESRHIRPNPWAAFDLGRSLGLAAGLLVAGTAIGLVGARLRTPPAPRPLDAARAEVERPVAIPPVVAPRPALPPEVEGPAVAVEPQKAPRLEPDPRANRDPQRSVGQ